MSSVASVKVESEWIVQTLHSFELNMDIIVNWFRLDDWLQLIILASILTFVGNRMAGDNYSVRVRSRWFSAFFFLLYVGFGVHFWGLSNPTKVVLITVRALLASAVAYGVGSILFSITNALVRFILLLNFRKVFSTLSTLLPRLPKKKPVMIPLPPPPPRPPPPTLEERTEAARNRYQKRIQLIEKANLDQSEELSAKEKAKQTYLKEIDDVIT